MSMPPDWATTPALIQSWQYEQALDQRCDELAAALLDAAGELGWGSGEPLSDAIYRLTTVWRSNHPEPPEQPKEPKRRPISGTLRRQVWDRDEWTCQHCGTHKNLTVDHIMPWSKGGSDDLDNLQTLCGTCNSSKGARV